jgi:hypothetical protein
MKEDCVFYERQILCRHEKIQFCTQQRFDILTGFESTFTGCLNCHKIIDLKDHLGRSTFFRLAFHQKTPKRRKHLKSSVWIASNRPIEKLFKPEIESNARIRWNVLSKLYQLLNSAEASLM